MRRDPDYDQIRLWEHYSTEQQCCPADLTLLRVLMEQHNLKTTDIPEIGSKSIALRVLNGERELNKKHIEAFSARFNIEPGLFFNL